MAPLAWWERILAAIAAGFLVVASPISDQIGFALALVAAVIHVIRARSFAQARRVA